MFSRVRASYSKEKGQTVVLVAVMMMALLGLTAMAIDLSYVFVERAACRTPRTPERWRGGAWWRGSPPIPP